MLTHGKAFRVILVQKLVGKGDAVITPSATLIDQSSSLRPNLMHLQARRFRAPLPESHAHRDQLEERILVDRWVRTGLEGFSKLKD